MISYKLLHHTITLLFGGKVVADTPIFKKPGKVGFLVAEKISQMVLEVIHLACKEFSALTLTLIKTVLQPSLITKMAPQEQMDYLDFSVFFSDVEASLSISFQKNFFMDLIPGKKEIPKIESDFWRSAIETRVASSSVEIKVVLPQIKMKLNDFIQIKEGDLINIADPTVAFINLNDLALYRGSVGQKDSKRVIKIDSQI